MVEATALTESAKRDESGKLLPGHHMGRPKKGNALRDLLKGRPLKDKKALVEVAYAMALDGDVHWAEWIAKHSGESGSADKGDTVNIDKAIFIREYSGFNPEALQ